jgi:hypothetical protein
MKIMSKVLITAAASVFAVSAFAGDWDKLTKINVNEPVRLPGITLQPGDYSMKLLEDSGNRHVVEVRDADGKGLAIILALPNYRLVPKDKTVLTYWETPAGQPRAIRAWFFPGDNFGQEFVYPKTEADQIATYVHAPVVTMPDNSKDLKTAELKESDNTPYTLQNHTENNPAPATVAQAEPQPAAPVPAPTPVQQPEPQVIAQATPPPAPALDETPAPASQPTPATLPQTGSDLPLVGLMGGLSLAAFLSMRPWKKSGVRS